MCSWDQSGLQSTGQPLFAYSLSSGAAGCVVEKGRDHISPIFSSAVSLIGVSAGNYSSFARASAMATSCSSGDQAYKFCMSVVAGILSFVAFFIAVESAVSQLKFAACLKVCFRISSFPFRSMRFQSGGMMQEI